MNSKLAAALAVTTMLYPAVSFAQPAPAAPVTGQVAPAPMQPMVVPAPTAANAVLPQGTNIRLRTLTELHSQQNRTGERFDLEVAEDVVLNGVVIIPRGSPATGEITRVRRRGMWGRSGRLETRLLSVRANGVTIPIRGTVAERGDTGTAGVVASIVALPIAGFFVTGTSAVMPSGTGFNGLTESDLPIVLPPEALAARTIAVPAAVIAAPPAPAVIAQPVAPARATILPPAPVVAAAAVTTVQVQEAGGPDLVLHDCNVGGTNCRVLRRYNSERVCSRERVRYVARNRGREAVCRPQ